MTYFLSFRRPDEVRANGDDYFYTVKPKNWEDALAIFEVYCNHLHYTGWKKVKTETFDKVRHGKVESFKKDDVVQLVVVDCIKV